MCENILMMMVLGVDISNPQGIGVGTRGPLPPNVHRGVACPTAITRKSIITIPLSTKAVI